MNVSLKYLERCSAQTGYPVPPLEKIVRLGKMAGDATRHPFLGSVLALKGGTALNLCSGPPKRLSVDLDFNYIGHRDREKRGSGEKCGSGIFCPLRNSTIC